jgi:hypothetical protein
MVQNCLAISIIIISAGEGSKLAHFSMLSFYAVWEHLLKFSIMINKIFYLFQMNHLGLLQKMINLSLI